MEIGEDGEKSNIIHSVQSLPSVQSAEEDGGSRKSPKNRRVSFASSTQLAQYLEPINPFDTLGELLNFANKQQP